MIRGLTRMRLPDRFWARVQQGAENECWLWTGSTMTFGYGKITVNRQKMGAHQYSYLLAHGSIPDGAVIRHSCDNPPCVNPAHLLAGTQLDNIRDMNERGRHVSPFAGITHCKHGHEFTEENTRRYANGVRRCSACEADRRHRYHPLVGNRNAAKTHCPHGHAYSAENTIIRNRPTGTCRACRTCTLLQQSKRRSTQEPSRSTFRGFAS